MHIIGRFLVALSDVWLLMLLMSVMCDVAMTSTSVNAMKQLLCL